MIEWIAVIYLVGVLITTTLIHTFNDQGDPLIDEFIPSTVWRLFLALLLALWFYEIRARTQQKKEPTP